MGGAGVIDIAQQGSIPAREENEHRRAHRLHRSGQCARNLKAELGRPPGVDHGDRRARLRKAPFGVARAARGHNRSATHFDRGGNLVAVARRDQKDRLQATLHRSEEHTSELQSLMLNSYAVFCLNKKKTTIKNLVSQSISVKTILHILITHRIYYTQ